MAASLGSLAVALVSSESRVVTLPLACGALGYGIGSFDSIWCEWTWWEEPDQVEIDRCFEEAHRNGIAGGLIGVGAAAFLMTITDQWKKEVKLL